jgi:hypothetical protein
VKQLPTSLAVLKITVLTLIVKIFNIVSGGEGGMSDAGSNAAATRGSVSERERSGSKNF